MRNITINWKEKTWIIASIIITLAISGWLIYYNRASIGKVTPRQIFLLTVGAILTASTYNRLYWRVFGMFTINGDNLHDLFIILNFMSYVWDFLVIIGCIAGLMNPFTAPIVFIILLAYIVVWNAFNVSLLFKFPVPVPVE